MSQENTNTTTQGLEGPPPEDRPRPQGRRNAQGIRIDPEVEAEPDTRRTVISALVKHEPGVLSDVSGLFSRRQFNIESLTVGPTEDDDRARITLVIEEHEPGIEQAKKQLRKLVPVISVRELAPDAMRRELMLIKVNATRPDQVAAVAGMYDGQTVDASPETVTVQVTGSRQKIEAAIETFEQFGIREISRTGTTALARGTEETAATKGPASESTPEYTEDGTPTHPQTTPSDDD
ncbi:acetolactate synthase small subunit [Halomontanus rarus]|uniref:acetolactate synthase small subunit n=1 Tax=Halomontanus rarus TaxID=3034020 RepID=UPI001A990E2C